MDETKYLSTKIDEKFMIPIALVTGSGGLIGSEISQYLLKEKYKIIGIDNDARSTFFGPMASTQKNVQQLMMHSSYHHYHVDIRSMHELQNIFQIGGRQIQVVIHTAAQPSHDWAVKEPITDFSINAVGTSNLLECTRLYCFDANFIFMSTNKVYGDRPNDSKFEELSSRWERYEEIPYEVELMAKRDGVYKKVLHSGIDETMSLDQSLHSLFGASKVAADILVQEYGRYFGMKTVCLRGGCLTGPQHAGAELHGFLSYLIHCAVHDNIYKIYGYQGKQVRDNIHTVDVAQIIWHIIQQPKSGEVYNIGGGRLSNCSILEAIEKINQLTGKQLKTEYVDQPRRGDHQWYITDMSKFQKDYSSWSPTYNIDQIIEDIYEHSL